LWWGIGAALLLSWSGLAAQGPVEPAVAAGTI